jgi:hypothetical protein
MSFNAANFTSANNSTPTMFNADFAHQLQIFFFVYSIGYQYVMTISCSIGFIVGFICLAVLVNPKLKGDMYKLLILKTLVEIILQLAGMTNIFVTCSICTFVQSYWARLVKIIFTHYLISTFYTCSSLIEIALSYDRLKIFKRNSKYLPNVNFYYLSICIILGSILLNIPVLFSLTIVSIPGTQNQFTDVQSEFGRGAFFSVYLNIINALQVFIPLLILIVIDSLVAVEFKKYVNKKKRIANQLNTPTIMNETKNSFEKQTSNPTIQQKKSTEVIIRKSQTQKESNKRFTLMVLISSSLFIFVRLFNAITIIWNQTNQANKVAFDARLLIIAYFSFQITFFYMISNIFTYFIFNKSFRKCMMNLIKRSLLLK